MRAKRIRGWLAMLVLACLAACLAGGPFLAEVALHPGRRVLGPGQEDSARQLAARFNASLEIMLESSAGTGSFSAPGGFSRVRAMATLSFCFTERVTTGWA